jgi:7,8-dihydropterin-6-yl-methyl-4-(beta-D-ribofuranosyl)aminobenzene 5'-phosphate synthase
MTPLATPIVPPGKVTFTIVFDNYSQDSALETEWGYACLVETEQATVLFDTGSVGDMLLSNLAALGKDLTEIQSLVISHDHADHTAGAAALLDAGAKPKSYLLPVFSNDTKAIFRSRVDVVESTAPVEVAPGIYTTGSVSGPVIEQALIVQTAEGWVLITGCAHPGVVKMVERARQVVGGDVMLVMGGFHLTEATQSRVQADIRGLQTLGVQKAAPSHCTGDDAIEEFAAAFGGNYIPAGVGRVISIEP